jgi:hypothetical protein
MEKDCNCGLIRDRCPDQSDLVGGSQYANMPCAAIIKALVAMERRIDGNLDCSIQGLSPIEKEADKLYRQGGGISTRTVVELILNE